VQTSAPLQYAPSLQIASLGVKIHELNTQALFVQ